EKALVDTLTNHLGNFGVTFTKGDDGVYTVAIPGAPVEGFMTVADGYAYVTARDKGPIAAGKRLAAAKLLAGNENALVAATLRLDTIDPNLKQIALGALENQKEEAKNRKVGSELPAQKKLREQTIDFAFQRFQSVLTDGKAVDFELILDRKTDDLTAQLTMTAKAGSPLAQEIAGVSGRTSRFGPLAGAAAQAALNVAVPPTLRDALASALDEGFKQEQARQKDAAKRDLAKKVYDTLAPTLKAGQLDAFGGLAGPDAGGKYTLFGGIKLVDAPAVEKLARDLVPQIPDAKAKEAIKLDAETVNGVKVHKVVPTDLDAEAKRIFGPDSTALIAFPQDAVVAAFGADPGGVLRQVLAGTGHAGGPFRGEASVSKLAGLDKDHPAAARKAAQEAFGSPPRGDVIRVTVEGGPALKVRASMKGQVIKFGAKMDEATKGGKSEQ
ncbi:MAG TPA: hypothetical protein VGF55_11230, partial [Gemmataceae bacterium]